MIPSMHIIAWSGVAPWAEPRQVEQDLIISRALVELFSDDFLKEESRFRSGTALHKLLFPKPLRYSEDSSEWFRTKYWIRCASTGRASGHSGSTPPNPTRPLASGA